MTKTNYNYNGPLKVGIGGPVGSGKTTLLIELCREFKKNFEICAITNDIYTKEDAKILSRSGVLSNNRIMGVETGGCPHTAIREDASINLLAVDELKEKFKELKSLVYQYKDNKENEIKNLSSTQEELENDIENYKISYENLIDKVTLEIEDFVKKNSTNTSVS